jgi:hypothetical protein
LFLQEQIKGIIIKELDKLQVERVTSVCDVVNECLEGQDGV